MTMPNDEPREPANDNAVVSPAPEAAPDEPASPILNVTLDVHDGVIGST